MATTTDHPTPTVEELEEARQRVQGEAGGEHIEPPLFDAPSQLSFNVGAGRTDKPDFASLKIAGDLGLAADLKRQNVTVTVTDHLGQVITTRSATVTGIAFKDKTDKYGTTTERVHTATID